MEWMKFRNDGARVKFDEAKAVAEEHAHLKPSWDGCLESLERLGTNLKGVVEVTSDFSPLSFNWGVVREDGSCPHRTSGRTSPPASEVRH